MEKLILIVLSFLFLSTGHAEQSSEKIWNFDGDKIGRVPAGFTNERGDWKVLADPAAPSQPNVLDQSARNSGSTFNLILVNETNYKNMGLSVRMKAISGQEDQGGGLVWRVRDAQNYYMARYNPLEDNYRLYKVEKGKRIQLQSADIKHIEGWHSLHVTMEGNRIQCFYDDKKVLEAKDSTFQGPGKIGLWTKADARSLFDDLKVSGK